MTDTLILPISFETQSTQQTEEAGRALARLLESTSRSGCVAMYGDLGVGKTAFVRGFCSYFGQARVKSPTFSIVNEYRFDTTSVFHFDMYRIADEDELYSIGFYDYLDQDGVLVIEWSENIKEALPEDTVYITFSNAHQNSRTITIECAYEKDFLKEIF